MAGKDDTMEGRAGARWYETPTGILVPIPPISGGGGDVGASAAPAAPAPAAPAPSADSAPAPAGPAAPALPASPAPATSPAAPTPDAAGLRSIIDGLFSDPRLSPVARERLAPLGTPGVPPAAPVGDKLRTAWEDYQKAPDDQAAFMHLINTAVELGEQRTLSTLETRAIEQANETRGHQMRVAVAQAVNDAVSKEAPDVDLELFWTFGRRAQAETPRYITNRAERIEWQKTRMVELARAKQAQIRGVPPSASVTTPGRPGTPAPATPGATGGVKSMIEQVRDLRRNQYP